MERIIVVTGSASGLGKATAEVLEQKGNRVIRVDLKEGDVLADLSTVAGRQEAINQIKKLSPDVVDGIITWAGGGGTPRLTISVNFFGTTQLIEGLHSLLLKSAAPRVVVTSSRMSLQPVDFALLDLLMAGKEDEALMRQKQLVEVAPSEQNSLLSYGTAKKALAYWTRRLALTKDWGDKGILLNAIAPGLIKTPLTDAVLEGPSEAMRDGLLAMHPQVDATLSLPIEIANLAAFLLSEENKLLIGHTFFADRGTELIERGERVY
jgi:NAD(P)-dependent dehydrogenase (short-subunit alcohol dehydrogenase family)